MSVSVTGFSSSTETNSGFLINPLISGSSIGVGVGFLNKIGLSDNLRGRAGSLIDVELTDSDFVVGSMAAIFLT